MRKVKTPLSIIAFVIFALACGIDFGVQNTGATPTLAIQGAPTQTQIAASVPTSAPTVGRTLASATAAITPTLTPTVTVAVTRTPTLTPTVTRTPTPTVLILQACPQGAPVAELPPNFTKTEFLSLLRSSTPSSVDPKVNLIVNGDAEGGSSPQVGVADETSQIAPQIGWSTIGFGAFVNVIQYDANGFPKSSSPGVPSDHGRNFFGGGPGIGDVTASQTIDLTSVCPGAAAAIDKGDALYNFQGWLGGYANQDDFAKVTAEFKDKNGTTLTKATLGPVLAADRQSVTGFVGQLAADFVPAGTRSILVTMEFKRVSPSYDDGYADDLALYLGYLTTQ